MTGRPFPARGDDRTDPADRGGPATAGTPLGAERLSAVESVVVGEAVALELPAASVGLRLVSGFIDVVLSLLVFAVVAVVGAAFAPDRALAGVVGILTGVLAFVVGPAVLETLTLGRTVGKLVTGLRTVRDDAGPISFGHAFVRHLVAVVEIWLLIGVPALVCAVVTTRGKRLGDLVAGTYVVRDRFQLQLPRPAPMPPHLARWAAGADVAPLPDSLALAVRQLLARQGDLQGPAQSVLLGRIVSEVLLRVSPPPPRGTHPLDLLAAVAAERRRREGQRLWREADLRHRLTRRG